MLEFIFIVSQKFVIYKILNTLKPFWFAIDSSVLLNKGVYDDDDDDDYFYYYYYYYFIYYYYYKKGSLNICAHLSMKILLVVPNLMRTFFGNIFLILIMVRTFEHNYFLVRTKFGYLR